MEKLRVGVLISGRGSNFQALAEAARQPGYPAEIACAVSNVADAPGLEIAGQLGIPAHAIPHRDFADRESFDRALSAMLEKHQAGMVALAGFMRLHSPWFVERWQGRLLNIHPSLLPAFPGLRVQQQAIDAGVRVSGCTVHFVTAELDAGPIIAQAAVPVLATDSAQSLARRILRQEHRLYPLVVQWLAEGRVSLSGGRVLVRDATTLLFSSEP